MPPVSSLTYDYGWPQLIAIGAVLALIVWAVFSGRRMR
jgi:hypothetical protein